MITVDHSGLELATLLLLFNLQKKSQGYLVSFSSLSLLLSTRSTKQNHWLPHSVTMTNHNTTVSEMIGLQFFFFQRLFLDTRTIEVDEE